MIISAFQGVGKSTLAKNNVKYIDLESSCFDKANSNWYLDYCRVAMDLDRQGYIVFVSAHKPVRDYLKQFEYLNYFMVMYDESLKEYSINKVRERYEQTQSMKDYNALKRAETSFDAIFKEIKEDESNGLRVCWIKDEHYVLQDLIERFGGQ
jgi:hypothetical protein